MSVTADVAFERTANAAAVAFAAAPPFVSYRVDTRIVRSSGVRSQTTSAPLSIDAREVVLRTQDDLALIRTEGDVGYRPGTPRPLLPVVDALADWAFALRDPDGDVSLDVSYERPHRYAEPSPAPGDAVVVASVNGFAISYADAGPTQLLLTPATTSMRAAAAQPDHFFYRDVSFDPITLLPTRVTLVAPGETFSLDYTVVSGHWLLADFTYDAVVRSRHGPARAVTIAATYSDYTFPARVPGL